MQKNLYIMFVLCMILLCHKIIYASNYKETISIGQEERQPPLPFLKNTTVTLNPGQVDLNIDFSYERSRYDYAMLGIEQFERANLTVNRLILGVGVSIGILNRWEMNIYLPFMANLVENVSSNLHENYSSFNISDISISSRVQLSYETAYVPAFTLNINGSIPVGEHPYKEYPYNELATSSGHGAFGFNVSIVKSFDPAIIYAGIGYDYIFQANYNNTNYEPGMGVYSFLGLGYAVNNFLTANISFNINYNDAIKINNNRMYGTDTLPMYLGGGLSFRGIADIIYNIDVKTGLNDDSRDVIITFGLSRTF